MWLLTLDENNYYAYFLFLAFIIIIISINKLHNPLSQSTKVAADQRRKGK